MEVLAVLPTEAAAQSQRLAEVAPTATAQAVLAVAAEPALEPVAEPEPALPTAQVAVDPLPAEAANPTLRRVEALQRLRASLTADAAAAEPVTPRAANSGLLRRVEHLQGVARL